MKILSRTGVSLSDVYDVKGSIAGVEELESRDVHLQHEMGGTIFSERLAVTIRAMTSTAILQSVAWDVLLTDNPLSIMRVLGVAVHATAARVNDATISIRRGDQNTEIPIWTWDASVDGIQTARFVDSGSVADQNILIPAVLPGQMPQIMLGRNQHDDSAELAFRGTSTAFGAGTVEVRALIYLCFARQQGISSYGLPIPGW